MIDRYFKEYERLKELDKYDEKHFVKFKKEMDEIVQPLLNNWQKLSEIELENLIKKFGRQIARSELSTLKKELLSDEFVANTLVKIAQKYKGNNKILIEVISCIGNMFSRYDLTITSEIFQFLLEQTKDKKVNFYVSIFITEVPHFKNHKNRWDYVMSIPKIAPKDKSMNTFYRVINDNLSEIPQELKEKVADVFRSFIKENDLHSSTVQNYTQLMDKLDN